MTVPPRLPLLIRALLRCLPLGGRRDEATSDITDLFSTRCAERGRGHAYGRLLGDLVSVAAPRRLTTNLAPRSRGFESFVQDLRYGARLFRTHPGVIGATVGGLALAIAVGTSVFTILNASVLRLYGMDDPRAVVRVQMQLKGGIATDWPYHAFVGMRERARQSRVAAATEEAVRVALTPGETPARMDALLVVSGEYMSILGGRALIGRTLLASDDDPAAPPTVALNHRFWTTRLNADPAIVGKTIWLSGSAVTVVGVIESRFTGPVDSAPAAWTTFGSDGAIFRDRPIDRSSGTFVSVIARVDHGVTRVNAEQELSAIASTLPNAGVRSGSDSLIPAVGVRLDGAASPMDGPDAGGGLVLVGAILLIVGLVLALASANVANLLLAGTAMRGREISLRIALGAPRRRIARQLLTESLLMGVIAGVAGLLLSMLMAPVAARTMGLPDTHDVTPDLAVILFATGIALLSGFAAGLAPARYGAREDLVGALKVQAGEAAAPVKTVRTRRLFIGFQAAASTLLLVTAALFVRAAVHIVHVDLGFEPDRLVGMTPVFPRSGFEKPAIEAYWRRAIERVRAMPSVEQVALTSSLPLGSEISVREVGRMAQAGVTYQIFEHRTSPEYFSAAGFRIVRGRSFGQDDVRANAPVAVVSESVVRDFFNGTEPLGASLSVVSDDLRSLRIIGVVAEAVTSRMRGRGNGSIYRPLPASELGTARLVVRSEHPELMMRDLETVLRSVDPRVRPDASLISANVDRYMKEPRILAGVSGTIALLAVFLAVLGVYGVTTFVVSQRLREMQVRRAIGASAGDIAGLLTRQSLMPVAVGLTAGLIIAVPAARVLTPALAGLSPYDPSAIIGAATLLLSAAIVAILVPALRATRADPAALLRA